MTRTRILWPAAALLLAAPFVVAGPPERPAGRMAFDEVADGLRRYRHERDSARRRALLWKLAPRPDPRVAVALGEVLAGSDCPYPEIALLAEYHLPESKRGSTDSVWDWWRENEAELRRRARELP
ncbi:MAG TPA: hypothetical protein VFW33_06945 [Gemmataceae bacterium]|nr:hypothetical protein [Gemmataceae bacterium]